MLLDLAIPADRNVQKEAQKKLKCNSLCTEVQRMCDCTVPAICGATGAVTKGLKNDLKVKAEKHSVDSVHKTAVFGTAHEMRRVLQCDTGSVRCGDRTWFERRSVRENRRVSTDNNRQQQNNIDDMKTTDCDVKNNICCEVGQIHGALGINS